MSATIGQQPMWGQGGAPLVNTVTVTLTMERLTLRRRRNGKLETHWAYSQWHDMVRPRCGEMVEASNVVTYDPDVRECPACPQMTQGNGTMTIEGKEKK